MSFYGFAKMVVRGVSKLLYRVQVIGTEQIPQDRGFILCSNHISDFDPILVGIQIKQPCYFMAKEELFRFPPLGALLRALGAFPVARGKGDTTAIDHAVELVKAGRVLAIFPEGTRSKDGKLLKLKSGAMVIASQTGGDILPCIIKKGNRAWIRRRITVHFGTLIPHKQLGITGRVPSEIKAANRLLTDTMTRLLEETHA
jgi:1-acyl-sn-glycerol-3-phosphate acyltransferase